MLGIGIAVTAFVARLAIKNVAKMPSLVSPYYRGGFESKMSKREAALILNVAYVMVGDGISSL